MHILTLNGRGNLNRSNAYMNNGVLELIVILYLLEQKHP